MKKITLLIAFVFQISFAQNHYDESGHFHFTQINEVDKNQDEIYSSVKKWIATNFKDANSVIQMDSKENIVCKGTFKMMKKGYLTTVRFTLDIAIKNEKFKLEIHDINITDDNTGYPWNEYNPELYTKEIYKQEQMDLIESMTFGKKIAMNKLENEKFVDKQFNLALEDLNDTSKKLIEKSESINKDILVAVSTNKTDW